MKKKSPRQAGKRPSRTPREIRDTRLETLRGIMEDVYGDPAWRDTDLEKLESWIAVDDELTDREWLDTAKNQLIDQSLQPEHAGAPSPNVYQWNNVFISAYRTNMEAGMEPANALQEARQEASDMIPLTPTEAARVNLDPRLYRK